MLSAMQVRVRYIFMKFAMELLQKQTAETTEFVLDRGGCRKLNPYHIYESTYVIQSRLTHLKHCKLMLLTFNVHENHLGTL